jgi:hypothetical protein
MEKLDEWNAIVISKDESGSQSSLVSLIDYVSPSHYRLA